MRHLGRVSTAYGFCTQAADVYRAGDLIEGQPDREDTEQDVTHRFITDEEFRRLVLTGGITDSATLAASSLYMTAP